MASRTRASLLALLLLTGCVHSPPRGESKAETTAAAVPRFIYQCSGGGTIQASYPSTSTAVVTYDGRTYHMNIAISASGARYVGEGLVWWTKGTGPGAEGTLYRHGPGDTMDAVLEICAQTDRS